MLPCRPIRRWRIHQVTIATTVDPPPPPPPPERHVGSAGGESNQGYLVKLINALITINLIGIMYKYAENTAFMSVYETLERQRHLKQQPEMSACTDTY